MRDEDRVSGDEKLPSASELDHVNIDSLHFFLQIFDLQIWAHIPGAALHLLPHHQFVYTPGVSHII